MADEWPEQQAALDAALARKLYIDDNDRKHYSECNENEYDPLAAVVHPPSSTDAIPQSEFEDEPVNMNGDNMSPEQFRDYFGIDRYDLSFIIP